LQDFFIVWAEKLITVFVVVALIAVGGAGLFMMFSNTPEGGFFVGLMAMLFGALYVVIVAGVMFVAFGIYRNTLETNRLLAELLRR